MLLTVTVCRAMCSVQVVSPNSLGGTGRQPLLSLHLKMKYFILCPELIASLQKGFMRLLG